MVQAQVLLNSTLGVTKDQTVKGTAGTTVVPTFLSPNLLGDLQAATTLRTANMWADCSSVAFLADTVLDDARLLLLEGSSSSHEKARTLASYCLLASTSSSGAAVSRAELLSQYLASTDALLDSAIGAQATQQQQPGKGNNKGASRGQGGGQGQGQQGEQLVAAVRVLQTAILDAHLLFFKQVDVPPVQQGAPSARHATTSAGATAAAAATSVDGLVTLYQAQFIRDVDRALAALVSLHNSNSNSNNSNNNNNNNSSSSSSGLGSPKAASADAASVFLASVAGPGRSAGGEVRKAFDEWLAGATQRLSEWSRAALADMGSALEVARLQQRVWTCATVVPVQCDLAEGSSEAASAQAQQEWERACAELLAAPKRRRAVDGDSGRTSAGTMLWSRVFRQPFVLQVERLLRESCQEVLGGAKALLLHALAGEGVLVDPHTLAASVAAGHKPTGTGTGGEANAASAAPPALDSLPLLLQALCVPSPRLFRRAEAVRQFMQDEIGDLLRDVVMPVQDGDPEASQGLSRALYVQCSQLVGHVAVLLRSLCASLTTTLETQARLSARAAAASSSAAAAKSGSPSETAPDNSAALLSGLLLVGRLAWLLKIRGRFVEEALAPARADCQTGADAPLPTATYDIVSLDQLRSAFEIADTNGDGVLTYLEAVDAVQALTVSDSAEAGHERAIPFLAPRLTPSVNYQEFALLCAHMLTGDTCSPVGRLGACLDELLASTHRVFAERSLTPLSLQLSLALEKDFGLCSAGNSSSSSGGYGKDGHGHGHGSSVSLQPSTFRSSWRRQSVELDGGEREQVAVPTACCSALSAFFFLVAHVAATSLLSIDTVQELPGADLYPAAGPRAGQGSGQSQPLISRLALFATTALYQRAVEAVAQRYMELLKAPSAAAGEGHGAVAAPSEEDVALQACFDLLVCEALTARLTPSASAPAAAASAAPAAGQGSRLLKTTLAGWKARLDPINAELLVPLLQVAAARFAAANHLLLPCLQAPSAAKGSGSGSGSDGKDSSPPAADSPSSAIAGVFPAAQPSRFALLPLPMSTHFQSTAWGERSKGTKKQRPESTADDDDGVVGASLSTTETLGKSLMSSIGGISSSIFGGQSSSSAK